MTLPGAFNIYIDWGKRRTKMIDWKFIENLEGKNALHGYVPLDKLGYPIGESGVTIGTGVDLGQVDRTDLVLLLKHIPDSFNLISKLLPYVGLKKVQAMQKLLRVPLEITKDESETLSSAMREKIKGQLVKQWEKEKLGSFDSLPNQVQTVLMSLAYNFGSNLKEKLPHTWDSFVRSASSNDWKLAISFMLQFPSKNKELDSRRRKEALLLGELILNG